MRSAVLVGSVGKKCGGCGLVESVGEKCGGCGVCRGEGVFPQGLIP